MKIFKVLILLLVLFSFFSCEIKLNQTNCYMGKYEFVGKDDKNYIIVVSDKAVSLNGEKYTSVIGFNLKSPINAYENNLKYGTSAIFFKNKDNPTPGVFNDERDTYQYYIETKRNENKMFFLIVDIDLKNEALWDSFSESGKIKSLKFTDLNGVETSMEKLN